jgi:DNA-binding transcriptional ArsR family regulator
MKFLIKKIPGELYSIFSSLLFICNIEYFKNQITEQWSMRIDDELIDELKRIGNDDLFSSEEAKIFFNIDLYIQNLFIDPEFLWNSENLDDYFYQLENQSPAVMREKLIRTLKLNQGLNLNATDVILYSNENVNLQIILDTLKSQPLDNNLKWSLLCLMEDPQTYINRFIKFINNYLPSYEKIKNKYKEKYENFISWLEGEINAHGADYVNQYFKIIDFNQFENVYLTYSLFELGSTHIDTKDNQCFLYLGILFKQYVNQMLNKQDIEKHLTVFKNFSDKTRFEIIKILIKKESFGQEIAEKLNITTATVSYHIDYLLGASLVQVTKKGRKVFYKINRDEIRDSISFLEKDLGL